MEKTGSLSLLWHIFTYFIWISALFFFPVSKPYIATIHRVMIIPPPASQVRESVGSLTGRHSAPQA